MKHVKFVVDGRYSPNGTFVEDVAAGEEVDVEDGIAESLEAQGIVEIVGDTEPGEETVEPKRGRVRRPRR